MINFPENPNIDDTYTAGGRTWRWSGSRWLAVNGTVSVAPGGGVTSYNELTDLPTLGTAAATNSTAYATAAQGTKADSALQASALTPYRTSAAQNTLDAAKVVNAGGASAISVLTASQYSALPDKQTTTIYIII